MPPHVVILVEADVKGQNVECVLSGKSLEKSNIESDFTSVITREEAQT